METNEHNIIDEQWNSLPKDVRDALTSVPWRERVRDIAKRENLTEEQSTQLETETLLILYGFASPDTYNTNIVEQVKLGEEQAERIFSLVNTEIISDIEKYLDEHADDSLPTENKKELLNIPPEILAKQVYLPEVPPENLPETVPGETAHDTPHIELPQVSPAEETTPETVPAPAHEVVPPLEPAAQPAVSQPLSPPVAPAPEQTPAKSIVEGKLSGLTTAAPPTSADGSYATGQDPYREPIE